MANLLHIVNSERRALRIVGVGAVIQGTTNTGVLAFTGTPTVIQGTQFPIETVTSQQPISGRGVWANAINDAVFGTTVKMTRRGIYHASLSVVMTSATTLAAQAAISLDAIAANLLFGQLQAGTPGMIDYSTAIGVAASQQTLKASNPVYITDALAGGAVPLAAPLAQGVGVIRFHVNNPGGTAVDATVIILAQVRAEITYSADLVG